MREKFVITILSQLANYIFTLLANYFLVFYMEVYIAGIWALVNSIVNLSFIFSDIGLIPIHYQYSEKKNYDKYFGSFLMLKILLIIFNINTTLILITILRLWKYAYLNIIFLLLISNIITSFLSIFTYHLKGKLKIFKVEMPLLTVTFLLNIFKLYIAFNITFINNPLYHLGLIFVIFNFIHLLIIIIIGLKDFSLNKPKKLYLIEYLKDVKPLIIVNILTVIVTNVGNVILAFSYDNESLAYFYLVNGYILPVISILALSMVSLWIPLYSKHFRDNTLILIKNLTHKTEKYISIIILCIILFIYVTGDNLFSLFLPKYLNSLPILYFLLFYVFFEGLNRNHTALLIAGKNQKLCALLVIINKSLKLILFFILIPKAFLNLKLFGLGSIGYALALVIPESILTIMLYYVSYKKFKIKPQKSLFYQLIIFFLSLFLTLFFEFFLINNFILNEISVLIIIFFVALGLFVGMLFIFKILTRDDLNFILSIFKVKNYLKSMREEF